MTNARQVAELAARNSYGRLVAYLVARSRDLAAAEDALGDAFLAALKVWTETGVPQNPEAWLLTTAKNRLIDRSRRSQVHDKAMESLKVFDTRTDIESSLGEFTFADERLKLLFVCAHPAINPNIHTPLMLQMVLGLNANQIGSAFLVAPTTMSQRLVRAKMKIKDTRIAFEIPAASELPKRLEGVLEAIYAAYTNGWDNWNDPREKGLAAEAIWLARLCKEMMPEEPEIRGLLALMLHCEARRAARRHHDGAFIPLSEQDPQLWSKSTIEAAEQELKMAQTSNKLGRFQLEAAIQSSHAQRGIGGETNWEDVALLYEGLIQFSPTLGALVGHAAAIAQFKGADRGLALLAELPIASVKNYQPFWSLKSHLHHLLDQQFAANEAYLRAIGLTEDPSIREFLILKMHSLTS